MGEEKRQVDCFSYCMTEAYSHIADNKLNYAAVYLENAARSLRDIHYIREGERNEGQVNLVGHVLTGRSVSNK